MDELPTPHIEEIGDEEGNVVTKIPEVRRVVVLEGFHIGNQTAGNRQSGQNENKKRKCHPEPSEGQSVVLWVLPGHEEKQEGQEEEG